MYIPKISQPKGPFGTIRVPLFRWTTGANLLIDEIKPPSIVWSAAPRQVSIALTNACDLKCAHCYAPKIPARVSYEQIAEWTIELDHNGCIGVGFGGGEPTLFPLLPEICCYVTKHTSLAVSLTTHGHHLTDRYLDRIAGNINFIRFSMDGVRQTYEAVRGRPFRNLLSRIGATSKIARLESTIGKQHDISDIDDAAAIADRNLGGPSFCYCRR